MPRTTPPLAEPSSLVRTMPVISMSSLKVLAWEIAFWPVVASRTIQVSCGAPGHRLVRDAAQLLELVHQAGVRVQAAGGIADHDVEALVDAALDRVEDDRRRIAAGLAPDDRDVRRACPTPRAARWRRRGTCRRRRAGPSCPRRRSCLASLPIVVVLPTPLTPRTSRTNGLLAVEVERRRVDGRGSRARSRRICVQILSASSRSAFDMPVLHRLEDPVGGARPDVGGEQDLLELLEGRARRSSSCRRACRAWRRSRRGSSRGRPCRPRAPRRRPVARLGVVLGLRLLRSSALRRLGPGARRLRSRRGSAGVLDLVLAEALARRSRSSRGSSRRRGGARTMTSTITTTAIAELDQLVSVHGGLYPARWPCRTRRGVRRSSCRAARALADRALDALGRGGEDASRARGAARSRPPRRSRSARPARGSGAWLRT